MLQARPCDVPHPADCPSGRTELCIHNLIGLFCCIKRCAHVCRFPSDANMAWTGFKDSILHPALSERGGQLSGSQDSLEGDGILHAPGLPDVSGCQYSYGHDNCPGFSCILIRLAAKPPAYVTARLSAVPANAGFPPASSLGVINVLCDFPCRA